MIMLLNTLTLIARYGDKLINNTITDQELITLGKTHPAGAQKGTSVFFYPVGNYRPADTDYSDERHTTSEAMRDFVAIIAPHIPEENFHALVGRFIMLAEKGPRNSFMRGSTIEKYFLSYEIAHYSEASQKRFEEHSYLQTLFSPNELKTLQANVLQPNVTFFKSMASINKNENQNVRLAIEISQHADEILKKSLSTLKPSQ